VIRQLGELTELVCDGRQVYLRYSLGPEADAHQVSRDYESGLELPGLSVIPLAPPAWWSRPVPDWLARQVCKYVQLADSEQDRHAWVLTGQTVGLGPDQEPLLADPRPLAVLSDAVLEQARRHYHERFDVGRDSRD
jgi:Family of unknown function (DUF6098)